MSRLLVLIIVFIGIFTVIFIGLSRLGGILKQLNPSKPKEPEDRIKNAKKANVIDVK
ncbi:MAG: hypothetical protein AAF558_00420 [Verrucomicrobiota bacterium]